MQHILRNFLSVIVFVFAAAIVCAAQTTTVQDDDDLQSWNDVQLTVGLNKKLDLYAAGTMRFGKNISRLNDARVAIGLTFKPTSQFSFTPFVTVMRVRNSAGVFQPEYRANLRGIYRFRSRILGCRTEASSSTAFVAEPTRGDTGRR